MKVTDFKKLIFSNRKKLTRVPHLQWHITDKCNLRCSHCYQDEYSDSGLALSELLEILEQFRCLVMFFRRENRNKAKGHITLTGGEPFVNKNFLALLECIEQQSEWFTFSILTNGLLIDDKWSVKLAKMQVKYIQVSLDGDKNKHDQIRGAGSFDKTVLAIKRLKKQNIRVLVSFTATKMNHLFFSSVADICRKLNVNFLWSDRLIPEGSSKNSFELLMNQQETSQFFKVMRYEADTCKQDSKTITRIKMHRALQFQYSGESAYRCVAGETLVTIMPNGDLFPCRRMPVKVGNVLDTPLASLYYQSPLLRNLRDTNKTSVGCESCNNLSSCRGGLKCLSYAVYGDAHVKDPGCSIR